jgi:crotonobetainyl-CoA:carnitine CoA-transferase CaiB-like acyl-CoA transferase
MDAPAWMEAFADNWLEFACTDQAVERFRAGFSAWVLDKQKDRISVEAQKLGIPLVPVNDASDVQRSPQFQHRGFFQPLEHPKLGRAAYPTTSYRMSATPTALRTSAPELGADAAEVLGAVRVADGAGALR